MLDLDIDHMSDEEIDAAAAERGDHKPVSSHDAVVDSGEGPEVAVASAARYLREARLQFARDGEDDELAFLVDFALAHLLAAKEMLDGGDR